MWSSILPQYIIEEQAEEVQIFIKQRNVGTSLGLLLKIDAVQFAKNVQACEALKLLYY